MIWYILRAPQNRFFGALGSINLYWKSKRRLQDTWSTSLSWMGHALRTFTIVTQQVLEMILESGDPKWPVASSMISGDSVAKNKWIQMAHVHPGRASITSYWTKVSESNRIFFGHRVHILRGTHTDSSNRWARETNPPVQEHDRRNDLKCKLHTAYSSRTWFWRKQGYQASHF